MTNDKSEEEVGANSKLDGLLKDFTRIARKILRRNASKAAIKIQIREYLIVQRYNEILKYVKAECQKAEADVHFLNKILTESRAKLRECLVKLNLKVHILEHINTELVSPDFDTHGQKVNIENEILEEGEETDQENEENSDKMLQTPEDFFNLTCKVVDTKFDGDPLKLQSFCEQVELLEPMVHDANKNHFIKFVLTHLTGRAR